MELFETTSQTLRPVLRALLELSQQAWCFLPVEDEVVQYCSREFLSLWRLPASDDIDEIAIPLGLELNSATMLHSAGSLGIADSWLRDIVAVREPVELTRNDGLTVRAVTSLVMDDGGRPAGRMVSFQVVTNAGALRTVVNRSLRAQARIAVLTPRELEVLKMVYDGFTNKAVGIRMKIAEKTVEKHRANIMDKLGVRNVVELVRLVSEAEIADVRFRPPETSQPQ